MAKKTATLLPATNELLREFGDRLRLARLRRRLSAKRVAERAGMAPMTLRSLERGRSGVTMGAYLAVMQVLGIETDLNLLGKADPVGRELQDAQLPAHTKATRPRLSPPAKLPETPKKLVPVAGAAAELRHAIESSPQEQLRKLFDSLPSEQMRKALEALPETQVRKARASMPSMQLREAVDRLDAPNKDIKKLLKPSEDTRDWIKKGGFASADALADLIDPLVCGGLPFSWESSMVSVSPVPYPIGAPGTPWDAADKATWLSRQRVQRSYAEEVVGPLHTRLPTLAEVFQYGVLDYTRFGFGSYPLYAVRSLRWEPDHAVVVVTGGVHGYETSGVQGALRWIWQEFDSHAAAINLLVLPCISPWGYETINRWNPEALDPNRQFKQDSPAAESALAMACVSANCRRVDVHVDLHETTNTDNSEFGPAKAARDGVPVRSARHSRWLLRGR